MERDSSAFFSAIQLRVSQMKQAGWSGFHLTNIFIISHSWHQRPFRNNTFTGISALNYAHPRVSETTYRPKINPLRSFFGLMTLTYCIALYI